MKSVYNLLWDSAGPKLADKIRASVPYTSDTSPGCKNFSDADLIQILGYVAVVKTGGTATGGCMFRPGRTDDAGCDDTTKLPSEAHDDTGLLSDFGEYSFSDALAGIGGLSLGDGIATLSGAHTIGKSRAHDKSSTSMGFGSLSGTPDKFDGAACCTGHDHSSKRAALLITSSVTLACRCSTPKRIVSASGVCCSTAAITAPLPHCTAALSSRSSYYFRLLAALQA
eukprot:16421-Heterococcus_DN1.PRE.1